MPPSCKEIYALRAVEKKVEAFDPSTLNPTEVADRELVLSTIRGALLQLETIRPWQKNPDVYSSGISNSVFVIMSRKFAPPTNDWLVSSRSREADARRLCSRARKTLRILRASYTEIAFEQLPDIIQLFSKRCARSLHGGQGPGREGRVPEDKRCRDRRA